MRDSRFLRKLGEFVAFLLRLFRQSVYAVYRSVAAPILIRSRRISKVLLSPFVKLFWMIVYPITIMAFAGAVLGFLIGIFLAIVAYGLGLFPRTPKSEAKAIETTDENPNDKPRSVTSETGRVSTASAELKPVSPPTKAAPRVEAVSTAARTDRGPESHVSTSNLTPSDISELSSSNLSVGNNSGKDFYPVPLDDPGIRATNTPHTETNAETFGPKWKSEWENEEANVASRVHSSTSLLSPTDSVEPEPAEAESVGLVDAPESVNHLSSTYPFRSEGTAENTDTVEYELNEDLGEEEADPFSDSDDPDLDDRFSSVPLEEIIKTDSTISDGDASDIKKKRGVHFDSHHEDGSSTNPHFSDGDWRTTDDGTDMSTSVSEEDEDEDDEIVDNPNSSEDESAEVSQTKTENSNRTELKSALRNCDKPAADGTVAQPTIDTKLQDTHVDKSKIDGVRKNNTKKDIKEKSSTGKTNDSPSQTTFYSRYRPPQFKPEYFTSEDVCEDGYTTPPRHNRSNSFSSSTNTPQDSSPATTSPSHMRSSQGYFVHRRSSSFERPLIYSANIAEE